MRYSNFENFGITKNGFLPESNLSGCAAETHAQWEDLALNLPRLIPLKIRSRVDKLPLLSTEKLTSQDALRRAYVLLAFVCQAYIRGGERADDILAYLPPQLAVPFLQVSKRLGLPPVITYAATCLWNFRSGGADLTKPENMETVVTFTGTQSESWFYRISIAIEARGAKVLCRLLQALRAAEKGDNEPISPALYHLEHCIKDITNLLQRMNEKCDATIFYNKIRPFLTGSKNVPELPNGVFYDEGNGRGDWKQLRGGSNGQSTLIQLFDRILGISHESNGLDMESFHEEMRHYMPAGHRRLLEEVGSWRTIRQIVLSPPTLSDPLMAYNAAVDAMYHLRSKHLSIASRYIVVPSSKAGTSPVIGTGGTALASFLKGARKSTRSARF